MMTRLIKLIIWIAIAAVIAIGGMAIYSRLVEERSDEIEVSKGRIEGIEALAELCSVELYNDVPMLDTINHKVMFAILKQRGSISFKLDSLETEITGDTIRVILPPETIRLYESTEDESWEVVDTKAIGPMAIFRSDKVTDIEENALKRRLREKSRKQLYDNGTVSRARAEAAVNLRVFLEKAFKRPVTVTDPTPDGLNKTH